MAKVPVSLKFGREVMLAAQEQVKKINFFLLANLAWLSEQMRSGSVASRHRGVRACCVILFTGVEVSAATSGRWLS